MEKLKVTYLKPNNNFNLKIYTKPKFLDFIANSNLLRSIDLLEQRGM